jgi:hypothetical protein
MPQPTRVVRVDVVETVARRFQVLGAVAGPVVTAAVLVRPVTVEQPAAVDTPQAPVVTAATGATRVPVVPAAPAVIPAQV